MGNLEYQELKKEHLKDFFYKVYNGDYRLLIINGIHTCFFNDYCDVIEEEIVDLEKGRIYYTYKEFEELINGVKLEKFIIDKEKKFIVIC